MSSAANQAMYVGYTEFDKPYKPVLNCVQSSGVCGATIPLYLYYSSELAGIVEEYFFLNLIHLQIIT